MDLGTIREELRGDNYETPLDFCKDIRRIFINSKNYTPDKHSRVSIIVFSFQHFLF